MEQLLKNFNFMTVGPREIAGFNDNFSQYRDQYRQVVDERDILASLRLLRDGVCRPDFPGESEPQCSFAKNVLSALMTLSEDLLKRGKVTTLDPIYDFCMQFVRNLIQQGPGTSHVKLWICMMSNTHFGFKKYYSTLNGERLKEYLGFLKREFKSQETGPDLSRYPSVIDKGIHQLLDRNTFSDEAYEECRGEFIALYLYMELNFVTQSQAIRTIHGRMSSPIYQHYSRKVFNGFSKPEDFQGYLKYLAESLNSIDLDKVDADRVVKKHEGILRMLLDAIKNASVLPEVEADIFEFTSSVCKKHAGQPIHPIIEVIGSFFFHLRDTTIIKDNHELFLSMAPRLTAFLNSLEDTSLMSNRFADAIVSEVLMKCMSKSPEHQQVLINLTKALLRVKQPLTSKAAYYTLEECKALSWKGREEDVVQLMHLVAEARIFGSDDRAKSDFAGNYIRFCDALVKQLKRDRMLPKLVEKIVEFCLTLLRNRDRSMFEAGEKFVYEMEFNGKKHKDVIMSMFPELLVFLTDDSFPWKGSGLDYGTRVVDRLTSKGISSLDARSLTPEDYRVLSNFVLTLSKCDFIETESNTPRSVHYIVFSNTVSKFLGLLNDREKMKHGEAVINVVVSLLENEYEEIVRDACRMVRSIASVDASMLAPVFEKILAVFVDSESYLLYNAIEQIYPHNPKPMEPHFEAIFDMRDSERKHNILQILAEVAKKQPKLFSEENVGDLIDEMYQGATNHQNNYLMVLEPLSRTGPEKVSPHMQALMDGPINVQFGSMHYVCLILKNLAVRCNDEDVAETAMAFYEKQMRGPEDQLVTLYCLNEMRAIGGVYRHILEKRKPVLEDLKRRSTIQANMDTVTFILDVLEGRSLESLSDDIQDVKEDVEVLDTRVTKTETGLVTVTKDVKEQKQDLDNVKTDVKEQREKIGELEESVDETKAKVEELDSKTLSHAPFWSRDVAKLMNPEDTLDWRLLTSRLGYSNDDIRSWAQMNDPCMAMLNEWYATRKTSEATFAVLNALQEMDRMDAAIIVENAMKMAETVVEDEEFDYPEPPEVFLSYQWGIQNEVKLLKQHLEKAGFTCWMDIGQMGGGDKLFEKIDKGIRGAKLIISCVTEKYAKSPNCNREVNLSVGLGKPIIPLLMEKLSWPPPGSMGPIFSEYLFIRFFTRPGEETGDQRYWSAAKFQELLMQLNYNNVQPDGSKVKKEYKDWWCPVVEEIKIEKKEMKATTPASQQKQEEVEKGVSSPDVFISYQWGKQKQIHILYKRLSELGFTCWMDIHQMGGGDSLYDKIDRGVRGAKVVLTCVTTKYALSANCRREVSLADALKKPIVPLLLEKMTWPPTGPMSMVFTQLLYINFSKDELMQEKWDGEKFEELKVKLDQHVPDIIQLDNKGAQAVEEDTKKKQNREKTPPPHPKYSKFEKPTATQGRTPDKPHDQSKSSQQQPQPPSEQHRPPQQQQQQRPPPQQHRPSQPQQQPSPQQHRPTQQQQQQPNYSQPPPQRRQEPPPATEQTSKSCTIL